MKKFLLLSAAAVAMTANAEVIDKAFFSVPNDNTTAWAVQDAGNVAITPGKDYIEFSHAKNAGRMFNYFWNEAGWTLAPAEFPENTYKISWDFEMVFNPTDRGDFEQTIIPIDGTTTNAAQGNLATHNYRYLGDAFFRAFISEKADIAGEGGKFTLALNDTPAARNSWDVSTAEAFVTLENTVMYTFNVDVNVADRTTTTYIVNKASGETVMMKDSLGNEIAKTVHKLQAETDTRAGGFAFSFQGKGAAGNSVERLGNLKMSYKYDGKVAENPSAALAFVIREERDYMVKFAEGHVLHWILPGQAEEADGSGVAYTDAVDDEETGDYGNKLIECLESGNLQLWTSLEEDETVVSDVISVEVDASLVKMPQPTLTIVNVDEGYKKVYKVTVSNEELPLKPTIYLPYTIKDSKGAEVASGTADSGDEITMETAGTLEICSRDMTRPDGNVWYETSDPVIVENNVEYTLAVSKNFAVSFDDAKALPGFTAAEHNDNGSSHWDRIYSDESVNYDPAYTDINGNPVSAKTGFGVYPASTINKESPATFPIYLLNVDAEAWVNNFAPLVPDTTYMNDDTNAWYLFPLEGIVYWKVAGSSHNIHVNTKWVSDNAATPNIAVLQVTNGYDRPDKGNCTSNVVITVGENYALYRYDSAINNVRIYTYKGFTPGEDEKVVAGLETIVATAKEATIFNINGVRVMNAEAAGLYIMDGKVIMVK